MTEARPTIRPCGWFVLRTPLLPFDELLRWGAKVGDALQAHLRQIFGRPEVVDALYVASPSLHDAWEASARGEDGEPERRIVPALASYFARMSARATPFGLFAGCSVGRIGERTEFRLQPVGAYRRHSRFDMDYLAALTAALERDPGVRDTLTYRPNSTLYRAGGRLRFVEARLAGISRSYHLVAVDETDYLAATLQRAQRGATIAELAGALGVGEVTVEEAREFVNELIDSQILVCELEPNVTGEEPVNQLVDGLAKTPATTDLAAVLDEARAALEKIDAQGLGARPEDYRQIQSLLEPLPVRPEAARLFQVDMVKPVDVATLGPEVLVEIGRAVDVLRRLARRWDDPLDPFRDAFVERYERREVPLVEALDEEIGIGFGSDPDIDTTSLLEGLEFPVRSSPGATWDAPDGLLVRKLVEAMEAGSDEVVLEARDLEGLVGEEPRPLPDALAVVAALAAPSGDAVDRGDFRLVFSGAAGPSGARLLGRFCHIDPEMRQLVENHLRAEESQRPDAVFAEIVHLPEDRLGNVLLRPVLRLHEIPYLGRSGAPTERQIPITDLLVSVKDGRVMLRSQRLGREVVPRLSTAHDFGLRTVGVYRFLCALQNQGVADVLVWRWGPLVSAPHLPRVRSGRVVLARARWNLSLGEIQCLSAGTDAVRRFRRERRLPRWICLADGDNELVVDLDNESSVGMLLHQLRPRQVASLVEMLPDPNDLCVFGPEGRFVHELVIPFVRAGQPEAGTRPAPRAGPRTASRPVVRSFPPGSEWVYAKLYTGPGTADRVLAEVVGPIVRSAMANGSADGWFFIRYADPHWHLRVRVHGAAEELFRAVLPALREAAAPLLEDGQLWRIQLDTYEREVERYGGDEAIELAERLFRHDSDAALGIVESLWGDAGLDARWRLAIVGIDRLLGDFALSEEEKRDWARSRRDAYAAEFGANVALKRGLGARYRAERAALHDLLSLDHDTGNELWPGVEVLRRRSRAQAPVVAEIRDRERSGRLTASMFDLLASFAHMHANRLLRSAIRQQELAIYDLLDRLYSSRLARGEALSER